MKKVLLISGAIVAIVAGFFIGRMLCGACNSQSSCPATSAKRMSAVAFHGGEASVIQMKVAQVVGSEQKSDKLKAAVMKVEGVEKVSACLESGTVTIRFDHVKTGGIDPVTAAVKKAGFKYEMAGGACCSKGKGKSATKSCAPQKSACTGKDKEI